jgi:hypothetical protein
LANNIITRSIGGTLLELANATVNISTIIRMVRSSPRPLRNPPTESANTARGLPGG